LNQWPSPGRVVWPGHWYPLRLHRSCRLWNNGLRPRCP